MSYNDNSFTTKLTGVVADGATELLGDVSAKYQAAFKKYHKMFFLDYSTLGKEVIINRKKCIFIGLKDNCVRDPFIVKDINTNKLYRVSEAHIKHALGI